MSINPLTNQNYINKDFQTIYPELLDLVKKLTYKWDPTISNESDPGVVLIKLNAIIADKNNYNIDKNVLECFPDTVTQQDNAYKLYEQLGYTMHWYKSATGELSFNWKSTTHYLAGGELVAFKIPAFTMISDTGKELVYTTTSEVAVSTDGVTAHVNAIQGVVRDYTIGGSTLIRPTMLDHRNRLYFPVSNVAENGIFISDANKNLVTGEFEFVWDDPDITITSGWKRVDNLYVQPFNTKCYKFGIDKTDNTCYIEFPSDVTDLMGEGLFMKYIQSDGASGNIAARRLSTFYSDVSIDVGDLKLEVSTNTAVTNFSSITNGLDPETIDSARVNYQRTVGTFDTLITLRDYLNYIVNPDFEQVSNGFVCDRTNDIQSSYKIVTSKSGESLTETVLHTDGDTPQMAAFDLKTYFMDYSQWPKFEAYTDTSEQKKRFKEAYDKSFRFKLSEENDGKSLDTSNTIKYLYENTKSVSHDFISKLSYKPLFIKNKFDLNLTVIPNGTVSQSQADDIEKNIYESLLKNLSSQNLTFGEELTYERVYDICNHSDNRVKAVSLENIEYQPYAVVYLDGFEKLDITQADDVPDVDVMKYTTHNLEDTVSGETMFIITDRGTRVGGDGIYELPLMLPSKSEYDKLSLNERLALEVVAKNILSGSTPYFIQEDMFKYTLEQVDISKIENVKAITTSAEIEFSGTSSNPLDDFVYINDADYAQDSLILDNETLFLYAPSLISDVTYSTSVKYVYVTDSSYTGTDVDYIPANRDYKLSRGQHLFMFRKDDDAKEAPYIYTKYGEGTILRSHIKIVKYKNERNKSQYEDVGLTLLASGFGGEGQIIGDLNNTISALEDTILGTNQEIVIKKLNSVKLEDAHNYCYWITNDKSTVGNYEYNNLKFKYVKPDPSYIDRSYNGGLIYVSNFARDFDNLDETYTLQGEENIYILRPIHKTVSYTSLNQLGDNTFNTVVSKANVTDYYYDSKISAGATIRCTWNITRNLDLYEKVKSQLTGKTPGYIMPYGKLEDCTHHVTNAQTVVIASYNYQEMHTYSWVAALDADTTHILNNGYIIDVIGTPSTIKFGAEAADGDISTFEYQLKPNEMFIYTDDNKKGLYILEHGTTITLDVPNKQLTQFEDPSTKTIPMLSPFQVRAMVGKDSLVENGEKAFTNDMWFDFSKQAGKIIGVVENQIIAMGPGTQIRLKQNPIEVEAIDSDGVYGTHYKRDASIDKLKITSQGVKVCSDSSTEWHEGYRGVLSRYTIQYKAQGEDAFQSIPLAEDSELGWNGYMILNINSGANAPQKLDPSHKHKFEVYSEWEEEPVIISPSGESIYVQMSPYISLTGGTKIDTTSLNSYGEVGYAKMLYYKTMDIATGSPNVTKIGDTYEVILSYEGLPTGQTTPSITLGGAGYTILSDNTILSIEFSSGVSEVDTFTIVAGVDGSASELTPLGVESLVSDNTIKAGVYYFNLNGSVPQLKFDFKSSNTTTPSSVRFTINPLFIYQDIIYSDVIYTESNTMSDLLESKIKELNNGRFDFTYVPNESIKIMDPLSPSKFFDGNHFYNKFVIPQIKGVNIKTTNKRA